jgi:two-component system phosphate regulon sensor histidine kinase PhoR
VLVFHDVTELKRLEQVRRDFVANVSHELRTPVSSIKGYAETLLEGALKDREHAESFLKIIYTESERLSALIDDLLSLSRVESGKTRMTLKKCSVADLINRAIAGLKKLAAEKSIVLSVDISPDVAPMRADADMVTQVLLNLIDNAIKYTPEKGAVKIAAGNDAAFIRINVADNGIGIPEKDIPRVFERFYRVDKGRSRDLGGTGLGLSIVKHTVQAHGGEVHVESTLGEGSTFSFTIPAAP